MAATKRDGETPSVCLLSLFVSLLLVNSLAFPPRGEPGATFLLRGVKYVDLGRGRVDRSSSSRWKAALLMLSAALPPRWPVLGTVCKTFRNLSEIH